MKNDGTYCHPEVRRGEEGSITEINTLVIASRERDSSPDSYRDRNDNG